MKKTPLYTRSSWNLPLLPGLIQAEKDAVISKHHFKISADWHTDKTLHYNPTYIEYIAITWNLVGALSEQHSKPLLYYFFIGMLLPRWTWISTIPGNSSLVNHNSCILMLP